eukprot:m.124870 g.124870  ORF g.124870 m.124870 type:complete len:542 (+) comp29086_c0_seq6:334-1959(+)
MATLLGVVVVVLIAGATAHDILPCPQNTVGFKSATLGDSVDMVWHNKLDVDTMVFWLDFEGKEQAPTILRAHAVKHGRSYHGHAYRVRSFTGVLLKEFIANPESLHTEILECEGGGSTNSDEISNVSDGTSCPEPTEGFASLDHGGQSEIVWISNLSFDVLMYWVDFHGVERSPGILSAHETQNTPGFNGHAFRFRTFHGALLKEVRIGTRIAAYEISSCGNVREVEERLFDEGRDKEYESLMIHTPCEGPSSTWSCVRTLNEEQFKARNSTDFGFLESEAPELVNFTIDNDYVSHIAAIPRVSPRSGPGYLVMQMPARLKNLLSDWFENNRNAIEKHEEIPYGFTNNDWLSMKKLNLDNYQDVRSQIVVEMRSILQWWCGLQLRHTSTYGLRIYRRGSVLTNHVDIMETHLASAVLQVAQTVDEDGGWPLEVLLPNKTVGEVYLQPGEMVLYEGAWIRHGRPMRFKGDEFANIFTHFSPIDWKGPTISARSVTEQTVLPNLYHGYEPGRCNTVGDDPSTGRGCTQPLNVVDVNNDGRDEL